MGVRYHSYCLLYLEPNHNRPTRTLSHCMSGGGQLRTPPRALSQTTWDRKPSVRRLYHENTNRWSYSRLQIIPRRCQSAPSPRKPRGSTLVISDYTPTLVKPKIDIPLSVDESYRFRSLSFCELEPQICHMPIHSFIWNSLRKHIRGIVRSSHLLDH